MAGQRRALDARMLAALVDRATGTGTGMHLTVHGDPDRLDPTWAAVGIAPCRKR
jgi:hypothetical protein